ncbi:MAG: hypothetical protein J7513_01465 [Solirubrobacteraceae bacterium]|nr:hypothetical protein [Solirubrobacteraceae bacterium]
MRRLFLRIAAAVLATACLPAAASAASFYDPPEPLPNTTPGTLLRAEPMEFQGATKPPAGTVGYRILYVSRTALGEPVAVSGSLVLPNATAQPRTLIGIAPGTHGMGDACAPSRVLAYGAEQELDKINRFLADGYAVVMTDYEGLGTPGVHPYGVNVAAGRDLLDALRAARQVAGTGLETDGKLGVFGYSQGGGAVGSAIEQQPSYAPELKITAAVVGGVLGEPARIPNALFGNFWAGVALMAVIGYDSAYDLGLKSTLTQFGRNALSSTAKWCVVNASIPLQYAQMAWFTKGGKNPVATAPWRARMDQNTLGYGKPNVPIYQYHGEWDQTLNYNSAKRVRARWCAGGADVRFVTVRFAEHFIADAAGFGPAANWLQAKLSGRGTPSGNCPAA